VIVLLLIAAAISWHFSDAVLVPDHSSPAMRAEVERVTPNRIVLERNEESERPGIYGLEWPGGHAIVGKVLTVGDDTVSRRLRDVQGYLVPDMDVGIESDVYVGNPRQALGLPFAAVDVPDELGPMPAWLIPGRTRTWAILVHGINGTPQVSFELTPQTLSADAKQVLLEVDGQTLTYSHGPTRAKPMQWPGTGPAEARLAFSPPKADSTLTASGPTGLYHEAPPLPASSRATFARLGRPCASGTYRR